MAGYDVVVIGAGLGGLTAGGEPGARGTQGPGHRAQQFGGRSRVELQGEAPYASDNFHEIDC
jgi:hypothetical protein